MAFKFLPHGPVLWFHGGRQGIEMPPTEAEKAKAHRAQLILYVVMALFILMPLVVLWIHR